MQSDTRAAARDRHSTFDAGLTYVAVADGVFLLLALWLTLASLTPAQSTPLKSEQPSVVIKPASSQSAGPASGGDGTPGRPPTHSLTGELSPRSQPGADGALVIEVPYGMFDTLQKASSIRIIGRK